MSAYPQLITGALTQFPIEKRRQARAVVNRLADGSSIRLEDPAGGSTGWRLHYSGITDAEATLLQQFFASCEGALNGFTFLDPSGNVLAWSEDFSNAVWQPGPFVALSAGVSDPLGGTQGFHLVNSGSGAQGVTQTLNAPGGYVYTFSVYVKAAGATSVTLSIGAQSKSASAGANWGRISVTAFADPAATSVPFTLQFDPGAIDLFGPQVEAQPAASAYKKSSTGGVYQDARFQDDALNCISTDPNLNSVTVNILYVNHL